MGADAPGPVIDLGVLGPTGDDEPPAGPGLRHALPGTVRNTAAAVLAVLAAVLLGGSAPPPGERVAQLAAISIDGVRAHTLGDELVYVLAAGADALSAYRLDDGTLRWTVPVDPGTFDVQFLPRIGAVLGTTADERTTAFDAVTGARRWRAPGGFAGDLGEHLLFTTRLAGTGDRMAVADPATGAARWEFALPADGSITLDERAGEVYLLAADGTLTVRRLADGAVLRGGRLDRQVPAGDPSAWARLQSDDGLLMLVETDALGATTVSTYLSDTFALAWRRPVDTEGVNRCGPLLCLTDARSVRTLDPRTGAERWTNRQWRWTGEQVAGHLVGNAATDDDPDLGLIDAATGRTVAELGPVNLVRGDDWLVLRRERVPGRRLVLGARTVVSRLTAGGPPAVLGTVSGVVWQSCRATGRYLVCPTVLGMLTVHRVEGRG
ncbi:outer membrane protein assembly factor BamB family protein [Spirilliplanes yamanashiensis]|uniref:Pyrrolo-quinoline quinone repeat domain-containing protein n=1 Tax=Spirilliplanes yamanashiensis TaxID=42233 RepID=A0A8J3Y474_9ACTN|nr:PQQ-binding-like beta-propeller repeat protein [Spirilliplanes yamanashiensis]MDP9819931.1 outer membrane protein assembly factor BamB [Spirilliplanes yamanashiensis]GIJ01250.1 hypothetical protein Sya03_06020 [Spirilliplanes yamanashiensis]